MLLVFFFLETTEHSELHLASWIQDKKRAVPNQIQRGGKASVRVLVPVAAADWSAVERTRGSGGLQLGLLVDASALLTLPEHICDEQFH